MKTKLTNLALGLAPGVSVASAADEPLPSWNDTAPKHDIVAVVQRMTKPGSPDCVPLAG